MYKGGMSYRWAGFVIYIIIIYTMICTLYMFGTELFGCGVSVEQDYASLCRVHDLVCDSQYIHVGPTPVCQDVSWEINRG